MICRFGAVLRRMKLACALATLVGTSGCGWIEDQYRVNPAFSEGVSEKKSLDGSPPPFDLLKDCMPADLEQGQCKKPTMRKISDESDAIKQATLRNRFQDYLLWRSEVQCERHKAGIMANQAMVNFSLSTVTTGVAATAALVIAPASNILAGIGAVASGTRSHFNENFYRQTLAPGVVRKINQLRTSRLSDIMEKRRTPPTDRPATVVEDKAEAEKKGVVAATNTTGNQQKKTPAPASKPSQIVLMADYTLEEAIADVERYHQQCSFVAGLSELIEPTARFDDTAKGIKQRIDTLRQMQADNSKQIEALGGDPKDATKGSEAVRRLHDTNNDISRQIMILQNQMLTAPLSVDAPPKSGTGG